MANNNQPTPKAIFEAALEASNSAHRVYQEAGKTFRATPYDDGVDAYCAASQVYKAAQKIFDAAWNESANHQDEDGNWAEDIEPEAASTQVEMF